MENLDTKILPEISYNEFHISRSVREACGFDERLLQAANRRWQYARDCRI